MKLPLELNNKLSLILLCNTQSSKKPLTQSLNKGQKIRAMVRELSMTQVAHVGPYQAQRAHIPCWGREGPWGGSGGVQSLKIGYF